MKFPPASLTNYYSGIHLFWKEGIYIRNLALRIQTLHAFIYWQLGAWSSSCRKNTTLTTRSFWHVCSDSQRKVYTFLCAWSFVVVKKIKQFPILLRCHNSMEANSYAIKMRAVFLTPIFSLLLPWYDKMGTFFLSSALDHPSFLVTARFQDNCIVFP